MGTKLIYVDENGVEHDANYTETKIVDSETSGVKTWSSQKIAAEITSAATDSKNLANATGTLAVSHGGTGATTAAAAKTNLGLENVDNVKFPIPVGFVYTQYPGELSPAELNFPGTWTDITKKFEGLFFRADGGNAKSFESCIYKKSSQGTQTITLESVAGISVGDKVVLINDNDHTKNATFEVKAISGNTLDFKTNIPSDLTAVLITQADLNKTHTHGMQHIHDISHTHKVRGVFNSGGSTPQVPFELRDETVNWTTDTGGASTSYSGGSLYGDASGPRLNTEDSGGMEARPVNVSVRIWKRTA